MFLSPWYVENKGILLEDPIEETKRNFKLLNTERTANLLNFAPGMFVTKLNDNIPTIDKSKSNVPTARNFYKIIEMTKSNFRAEIKNVKTGDRLSTSWNNLKKLTFGHLLTLNYDLKNAFQKAKSKPGFSQGETKTM